MPSDELVEVCNLLEFHTCCFHDLHDHKIDQGPDVFVRLEKYLKQQVPQAPEDVIKLFAKTRTFIRLKFLNKELKFHESKSKIRKFKQLSQFSC